MANEKSHTLPDFSDPPVIETVLSVQFAQLNKFAIPHFGVYWQKIRSEYPSFQVHPPLGSVTEEFGSTGVTELADIAVGVQLVSQPIVRCWFMDTTGNRLLQVQNDRFIHNWRKVKGDEHYPHYETIRPKFEEEWIRFCTFLKEEDLGAPEVNQCEATYVNHIEYAKGWKSYAELIKVIAPWSGSTSGTFLPEPERVNLTVRYLLPDNQGRLHISMQPVIRRRDGQEVLQLRLTARGRPRSSSIEDIVQWLDLGRKWVVEGFTDFTTKEMHTIWGRYK